MYHARWDHPDPKRFYAAELERGGKGHYDFLFANPLDQSVDLGVQETTCDWHGRAVHILIWSKESSSERMSAGIYQ